MLLQKYILVKFLLADPENETLAQLCQFFFVTDSLTYLEAPKSDKFKKELNRTANHILENIYHSTGFYVPVALPDEVNFHFRQIFIGSSPDLSRHREISLDRPAARSERDPLAQDPEGWRQG